MDDLAYRFQGVARNRGDGVGIINKSLSAFDMTGTPKNRQNWQRT